MSWCCSASPSAGTPSPRASLSRSSCSSLEAPGSPASWLTATSQYRGNRNEVEQTMREHPGSQTPGQLCRVTEDDADEEQCQHDRDITSRGFRFADMCKTEKARLQPNRAARSK